MSEFHSAFSDLIEQFIAYRIASGTWNTINYEYYIKRFDTFCAEKYPDMPLSQVMIDDWCSCHPNEMNRSRNTRIRVVTAFIKYLRKRNLAEVEPPQLFASEPHTYIPHSFKEEELRRFFYECDHIQPKTKRLESILPKYICPVLFRLLYSSGIRTTEARQLARKNVDLTHGILDIQRSKGYDQHYVALHPSLTALLQQYDNFIDKIQPNREYFFQAVSGKCFEHGWLETWFRTIWKKANPDIDNVTAYQLRHHYATTNINSWDTDSFEFSDKLLYLAKSMGHRWTHSTLHYYSIVPRLADTIKDASENGFNDIITEVSYEEE